MHAYRGVQPVLTLLVAIGGAVATAAGVLYTCFPSEFMSFLHAFIGSVMKYSALVGILSRLTYVGKFLSDMLDAHKNDPSVCATVCK